MQIVKHSVEITLLHAFKDKLLLLYRVSTIQLSIRVKSFITLLVYISPKESFP